ncbi:hypothetical protein [Speluncibacter jeojiensis]|uniref:hypothetical protein n=1 Tax=Speluncibacter jeojiensis TaxID=2710754 RepID=UPI00240EFA6D|nr:hypothetical protein [Rhodococcus sp. D2-41]
MRFNLAGLIGYTLVLVGVVAAALWLVALAEGLGGWSVIAGVVALVCLLAGGGLLVALFLRGPRSPKVARARRDPLEPEVTEAEARDYERRHHDGDRRPARMPRPRGAR